MMDTVRSSARAGSRLLLLTGVPGVGKTTVIRRVAGLLAGQRVVGFYTEELRVAGQRQGFLLIGFGGQQGLIAHVDFPKHHRVGKYGVDVSALDRLAEATLAPDPATAVFLVDEIGKMECLSPRFVAAVRKVLASDNTVVATVSQGGGGFMAEVRQRQDSLLWEVTRRNRDQLPTRVMVWLKDPRGGGIGDQDAEH